ncbi:MAG: hypothetical protein EXQ69_06055 [Acidimicrobiia bacterium]|nr:hypothetical protein [Acidimicrobiia bacterium]
MTPLKALLPSVRSLLDDNFRSGQTPRLDVKSLICDIDRQIDIDPVIAILDESIRRFETSPDQSDSWLAPRVHAALRLTRREAADKRIWHFINIAAKPDFVRWRFGGDDTESRVIVPYDRFMGEDSKNAIGRLWWVAELTRNGPDYTETLSVLRTSRFYTSWQALDAMHHRPAALAVCRFDREFNDNKGLTDSQSQRLAKAFNLRLSTLCLDALAINPVVDAAAIDDWCNTTVDETKFMGDDLPEGPDDEPVPENSIKAVEAVLAALADEIDLAEFKRAPRRSRELQEVQTEAPVADE